MFGQFHVRSISLSVNFTFGQFHFRSFSLSVNFTFGQFHFRSISLSVNFTFGQIWPNVKDVVVIWSLSVKFDRTWKMWCWCRHFRSNLTKRDHITTTSFTFGQIWPNVKMWCWCHFRSNLTESELPRSEVKILRGDYQQSHAYANVLQPAYDGRNTHAQCRGLKLRSWGVLPAVSRVGERLTTLIWSAIVPTSLDFDRSYRQPGLLCSLHSTKLWTKFKMFRKKYFLLLRSPLRHF